MKKNSKTMDKPSKLVDRVKGRGKSRASAGRVTRKNPKDHIESNTEEIKKGDTQLQIEIEKRKWAEEELKKAREELERRVKERTAELVKTQEQLSKAVRYLSVHKRQLRSMASHHTISEERERRKLAVYLHDNICQSLGVAKMKLDALRESGSSSDFMGPLDEVTQIIKSTIQDVRSVMVDLSPPVLHELGFEAALEWLAEQFHEQNGIPCGYENDQHAKPLDEDVRILLFQSVRELLINIIKHAQASKAKITVLRKEDNIHVIVEDNGVGFKSSHYGSPMVVASGFGFFSIRERLSSIGGNMNIKSWKGRGSRVTLAAPLKQS
jgi:signal transduction histidine kinase